MLIDRVWVMMWLEGGLGRGRGSGGGGVTLPTDLFLNMKKLRTLRVYIIIDISWRMTWDLVGAGGGGGHAADGPVPKHEEA